MAEPGSDRMASITAARLDDLDRLLPLVAAYHAFESIPASDADRARALQPLLNADSRFGRVWLIDDDDGQLVGYIAICFGYTIEFGGMDAFVDEFFIRRGVRGRGVGSEVLGALIPQLEANGLRALHLETSDDKPRLQQLYKRNGFRLREGHHLMTRVARKRT